MTHDQPRSLPGDRVRVTSRKPRGTNYTPPDGFLAPPRRLPAGTSPEAEAIVRAAQETKRRNTALTKKANWLAKRYRRLHG